MTVNFSSFDNCIVERIFFHVRNKKDLGSVASVCKKWHALSQKFLERAKKEYQQERTLVFNRLTPLQPLPTPRYTFGLLNSLTLERIPLNFKIEANDSLNRGEANAIVNSDTFFFLNMKNCNDVASSVILSIKSEQNPMLFNRTYILQPQQMLITPNIHAKINESPFTYNFFILIYEFQHLCSTSIRVDVQASANSLSSRQITQFDSRDL